MLVVVCRRCRACVLVVGVGVVVSSVCRGVSSVVVLESRLSINSYVLLDADTTTE